MATEKEYKELKEAVVMGVTIGNSFYEALEDGELTISDARHFIDDIGAIREGLDGISSVDDAIKAGLTPEQKADLYQTVRDVGDFGGDVKEEEIEGLVIDGLEIVMRGFSVSQRIKKLRA